MKIKRKVIITTFVLVISSIFSHCDSKLKITAEPQRIKANGISRSRITVELDAEDGTTVEFSTDLGHFLDNTGNPTNYITKSLSNGTTYAELISDLRPGEAVVTVSYTTPQGVTGTGSIRVIFYLPKVVGNKLRMECDKVNIGALRKPSENIGVKCYVSMYDRDGDPVSIKSLSPEDYGLAAEAGSFDPTFKEDYDGKVYFLYKSRGGASEPVDTEPISGEPSRADELGQKPTRNPRDGLVTLLFYVKGEEGFDDLNSNGKLDANEYFYDIGEPFLDVDDDGLYNELKGDRLLKDINGDGSYTEPNGRYDEETYVWTVFKILWSGDPHLSETTTRIEPNSGNFDIQYNQTANFTFYLMDQNMNPIASNEGDYAYPEFNCYYCEYSPSSSTPWQLPQTRGFEIDQQGRIIGNLFQPTKFQLSIKNINDTGSDENYSISVVVYSTSGPMEDGECCLEEKEYIFQDIAKGRLITKPNNE